MTATAGFAKREGFCLASRGARGARFVVHDGAWQTPAITELHAWRMAERLLANDESSIYLAFPWATLIDLIEKSRDANSLMEALAEAALLARGYRRVVTVCQHISAIRFAHLFASAGVTDLFWAHAGTPLAGLTPGRMTIRPFPLYPVNSPGPSTTVAKRHLFSFVGARPDPFYLDQARTRVFEELAASPGGLVTAREGWHFYPAVYQAQILKEKTDIEDPLANAEADEHRRAMAESIFVLCPSGSGPNTLRLWEAIDCGAIPVVISEYYEPPGDPRLWSDATLSCDDSRASIQRLPAMLGRIAADGDRLDRMRAALLAIRGRYGRENFVADIADLFASPR